MSFNFIHVNIVPVFDFGNEDDLYYIAMEYVSGCDLAQLIKLCEERDIKIPLGLSIWILIEICNGLDYAHRKHDDLGNFLQLIHRDITPQNILLSHEGEVKIADFGIAKVQALGHDETIGPNRVPPRPCEKMTTRRLFPAGIHHPDSFVPSLATKRTSWKASPCSLGEPQYTTMDFRQW